MMFQEFPYKESVLEWGKLHKRLLQVCFIPANPECLEPLEQVWLLDIKTKEMFLIHERNVLE